MVSAVISDSGLLQCSRVNVLDVRPVLEKGEEPFESIRYSLSKLDDDSSLVIVVPFEPRPLMKYVQRQGFSCHHYEVSRRKHWLVVYPDAMEHEVEITGPAPSFVLPAGHSNHVGYLDCRSMESDDTTSWINATLSELSSGDLLIVHCSNWNTDLQETIDSGAISRKSITSEHVRVEITLND
jgi:hypothetical protein